MNKLPARPQITFTMIPGKCKHEGDRYEVTATIGQISGRGISDDKKEAVHRAMRLLKRKLQAQRKAMFPILRYHRDEWRYAATNKDWGTVFGYGETAELAYQNYLNNMLFLDCLLMDEEKPRPRRRVPEIENNPEPVKPKGALWQRLIEMFS